MEKFSALLTEEVGKKEFKSRIVERSVDDLPPGDVLIEVEYSSINYKDALSASGNPGVTRQYPHTPGIDAAGRVVSDAGGFAAGDEVIVIGYDLGMNTSGGYGQYIRVPSDWVVNCPSGLSLRDSMVLGTAGFTAALCIEKLLLNGATPDQGKVLVTGATGGVGIVAVALLSKLGFEVIASTGKESSHDLLKQMGASEIIDRTTLSDENPRPMLKEQWAAAVDVVGGATLFNVVKSTSYGGSVAACGLVQSPMFEASVLPFILRGVNLLGVDSVQLPLEKKRATWEKLATEWKLSNLDTVCTEIGLGELDASLTKVLNGGALGRFLVNLQK